MKLNRPKTSLIFLLVLLLAMAASVASAATIQLRSECTSSGNFVLLGEVAYLVGADPLEAEVLEQIELFKAPSTRNQRVPVTEIQKAMLRCGVDLSRHRFVGPSEVCIDTTPRVSSAFTTDLGSRVCEAVSAYLRQNAGDQPWRVSVLSDLYPLMQWGHGSLRVVAGGGAPWLGSHTFLVTREAPFGTHTALAQVECHVSIGRTNPQLDVAIEGDGFFQVVDPSTNEILYTRLGNMDVNTDGCLFVTSAGMGRLVDPPISTPRDTTAIDITRDGIVSVRQPGNSQWQQVGTIQLARFEHPEGLVKIGENLYTETAASGQAIISNPGQQGLGCLRQGILEVTDQIPNSVPTFAGFSR